MLVRAWHVHKACRSIPPDEDEILHARRIVAQRCLYGVDKNPMAVDLAKLSLWLATLAKDHPFTFLDHALRTAIRWSGCRAKQIAAFHWKPERQRDFAREHHRGPHQPGHDRPPSRSARPPTHARGLAQPEAALWPTRPEPSVLWRPGRSRPSSRERTIGSEGLVDELAERLSSRT